MSATTETVQTKRAGMPTAAWAVLVILTVAGIAAWIYQLIQGIQVTGLSMQIAWGLYIAGFFTVAGAGAGLLALVGLSEYGGVLPRENHGKLLIAALAAFVISGFLILVDVAAPGALWRLIVAFRFSAPETLDFWALAFSVIVALVYFLNYRQSVEASAAKRLLAALGILGALAVVVIESLMLSQLAARPLWGAATIFGFLLSAGVGGLALATLVLPQGGGSKLIGWLAVGLVISLALVFAEVLAGLMSGNPRMNEEALSMIAGSVSPFFWFHLVVGLLAPIFLATSAGGKTKAVWIGALALLGVLANKLWLLVAGQEKPWLDLPKGVYFPNWVEFVVILGALAFGGLIYYLLLYVFRMEEAKS